jgi:hypothetical protein
VAVVAQQQQQQQQQQHMGGLASLVEAVRRIPDSSSPGPA